MKFASSLVAAGLLSLSLDPLAHAQTVRPNEIRVEATATGEERSGQADLWVMDVYFKPLGLIPVQITDPATGAKREEFVLYITYRAFNRPLPERGVEESLVNEFDPPVSSPLFVPEFTLIASDGVDQKVYADVVIPEALEAINRREKGSFKSAVSVVGPVPEIVVRSAPDAAEKGVSGVAMFRGVDPDADFYTVFLTGFSNGIRLAPGPDGKKIVQTKTIVQKYRRPGDRFDRKEEEFHLDGESKWIYR
jgi:hypothetical protein